LSWCLNEYELRATDRQTDRHRREWHLELWENRLRHDSSSSRDVWRDAAAGHCDTSESTSTLTSVTDEHHAVHCSARTAWDFSRDLGNLGVDLGFGDFDVLSWDFTVV